MGGCEAGRGRREWGGGGSHVGDAEGDGGVVIEEVVHGAHGHVVARRRLLDGPVPHVSIAALQLRRRLLDGPAPHISIAALQLRRRLLDGPAPDSQPPSLGARRPCGAA